MGVIQVVPIAPTSEIGFYYIKSPWMLKNEGDLYQMNFKMGNKLPIP